MHKLLIGSNLALGMASTTAMAQSSASGGAAASDRHGSAAGGATVETQDRMRHGNHGRDDAQTQRAPRTPTNSASTYGAGSVYTDRYRATGAVAAGGRASGTGSQGSSSSVNAYGATDRNGSTGEVYGDSSATSEPRD